MPSDITVSSLTATGGVGVITVSALTAAPPGLGCLPYMVASKIEFWAATSNNRALAVKIGENEAGIVAHGSLPASTTRYYWARAVDPAGNVGEFYPASATGGIAATTQTTQPPPNSVGTAELQNGAVTPSKISVTELSAITANLGTVNAGTVNGVNINGSYINGSTLTGGQFYTSGSTSYLVMDGAANEFAVYRSGSKVARIGYSPSSSFLGIVSVIDASGVTGIFSYSTGGSTNAIYAYREGAGTALRADSGGAGAGCNAVRGENVSGGGLGWLGVNPTDGGFGVYAGRGGVGPFTGAHDALIAKDDPAQPGDIVFDVRVIARNGWGDTLTVVAGSATEMQRGVVGVIESRFPFSADSMLAALPTPRFGDQTTPIRQHLAKDHHRLKINSIGEGQVSVCGRGGDLSTGDLICASGIRGKGQRQNTADGVADDIVRCFTVAKAREPIVFSSLDEIRRVACIYLCG
jgi:hypothetical protein